MTPEAAIEYLETQPMVHALWWFIENQEARWGSDVFFYLRQRYFSQQAEPKKLIRTAPPFDVYEGDVVGALAHDSLSQQQAEPVAWRYENLVTGSVSLLQEQSSAFTLGDLTYSVTPLYAAPPADSAFEIWRKFHVATLNAFIKNEHEPLKADHDEAVRLLREALYCFNDAKCRWAPSTTNSYADICIAAIAAYLAKKGTS